MSRKSRLLLAPMVVMGALALVGAPAMAAPSSLLTASSVTALRSSPVMAATITIKNFAYSAAPAVAPGAKITIMNQDPEAHTVTSDTAGAFDVTVPAGGSATITAPATAGSYAFHCNFHSNMHGSLVVQAAQAPAPAPAPAPARRQLFRPCPSMTCREMPRERCAPPARARRAPRRFH